MPFVVISIVKTSTDITFVILSFLCLSILTFESQLNDNIKRSASESLIYLQFSIIAKKCKPVSESLKLFFIFCTLTTLVDVL